MEQVRIDQLSSALETLIQDKIIVEQQYDFYVMNITKAKIHAALTFLKSEQGGGFTFLTTMCGIHFPEKPEAEFALMYQLHNLNSNERIRVRTYMPKSDLVVKTVTDIFPTANWMEREAYDFYGFHFDGHPQLSRILNMDEMNYHPMRKEYAVEDGTRTDKDDKYFGR